MKRSHVRELFKQYEGVLEKWQIKLALARISRFGVPPSAWDDTMQELAIRITRFKFNPEKAQAASEETILCRLIDNRIRMLARAEARHRARVKRMSELRIPTEDRSRPEDAAVHEDVRDIVADLPEHLQELCHALIDGETPFMIATRMGRHHDVVKRQIREIRNIFVERGGDKWLA